MQRKRQIAILRQSGGAKTAGLENGLPPPCPYCAGHHGYRIQLGQSGSFEILASDVFQSLQLGQEIDPVTDLGVPRSASIMTAISVCIRESA